MRRLLAAPLLLALLVGPAGRPAGAQTDPSAHVELSLVSQTSVATPRSPFRFEVLARHLSGPPLPDLSVSLWVYNPADSRSAFQAGLTGEPPTAPLLVLPTGRPQALEPGEEIQFQGRRRLTELAAREANALYPIKIQLESAGVAVTAIRSALLFIEERPLVPLNLSLIFVLDPDLRVSPDGTLLGDALEQAIRPGGRVDAILSSLEAEPARSTLVIAPQLLESLLRMSSGYRVASGSEIREVEADAAGARLAGQTLERIRALARSTAIEVVAPPYADLSIPSLVGSGLQGDIPAQIDEGRRMVERILGVTVPQDVLLPPGSSLDRPAARALADLGIETVILDPGTVRPPLPGGSILSPVATARLPSDLTAIVPDEGVAAYVAGETEPRLRAAHMIGELSALYLEQPSVLRGAAIVVRSEQSPAEDFLQPLLRALRDPPSRAAWLRPVKATQLAESVPATIQTGLRRSDPPIFSEPFVRELRTTRGLIDEFRAMAQGRTALPGRLRRLLLAAQDRRFVADQGPALDLIRAVRESLVREFRKIEAPSGTSITLTSHGGVIPLTLRSAAAYPVRIRVTLRSPRLEFLEGPSREVVLEEEAQALTFPVRAQTTGRFPVRILVDTPGGHRISESRIVVRSTAYNRIALFVTIGAAAFLALWWGRRFLRRTTT